MDLPFCKICGERHRLGFCPEYGPIPVSESKPDAPEIIPAAQADQHHQAQEDEAWHSQGDQARQLPPPLKENDAEKIEATPSGRKEALAEERQAALAQDQGRPLHQCEARPYTPDDMKQETMPVAKPRFDRTAYQRDLMRKRRANKWVSTAD